MDVRRSAGDMAGRDRPEEATGSTAPASPRALPASATCPATWQEVLPRVPDPINDLDIGDDGTLIVATAKGISHFTGSRWEVVDGSGSASRVAVKDVAHIYALVGGRPFYYTRQAPAGWKAHELAMADPDLALSLNGLTANPAGTEIYSIYKMDDYLDHYYHERYLDADRSVPVKSDELPETWGEFAFGPDGIVMGIANDNVLSAIDPVTDKEVLPRRGATRQVCTGSDGTCWALGVGGASFYLKTSSSSPLGTWEQRWDAPRFEQIAVGNRLQVVGLTSGNRIFRYCPDGYGPLWGASLRPEIITDFRLCYWFSSLAYELQPGEGWLWETGGPLPPDLRATAWSEYPPAFYNDGGWTTGQGQLPSDTQAFTVANQETHQVVIAFRGSEVWDLGLDVIWYRSMVPVSTGSELMVAELILWGYGSDKISARLKSDLPRYLEYAAGPGKAKVSVFITGHSLGGGLATFAAYDLVKSGALKAENLRVINFASPVVGNDAFAAAYNNLRIPTYRVLVPNDAIDLPWLRELQSPDFLHVADLVAVSSGTAGRTFFEYAVRKLRLSSLENHRLGTYNSSIAQWSRTLPYSGTASLDQNVQKGEAE
jgi:Lipase (class 3)